MTEYRGEYGQKWDRRLPRDSIKRYVRKHSVGVPIETIIAAILASCKRNPQMPTHMYDACERYARAVRESDLSLMRQFRL